MGHGEWLMDNGEQGLGGWHWNAGGGWMSKGILYTDNTDFTDQHGEGGE